MPLAIDSMEQEFPLLIYTYKLHSILDVSKGCPTFYKDNFGFSDSIANNLCNENSLGINTFNFEDKLLTAKAWMNIFLNNNTYAPENFADLLFLT